MVRPQSPLAARCCASPLKGARPLAGETPARSALAWPAPRPSDSLGFMLCGGTERQRWEREFMSILRQANYRILDIEEAQKEITDDETWLKHFTKVQTNLLCLPQ